jgi:D-glycero-alpha-D-manno-heptose-7-phosphate kinase
MRVISTAPTRISLAGGGTDVGEYAEKYGGACLNFGINIRQHMVVDHHKDANYLVKIKSSPLGSSKEFYERIVDEMGMSGVEIEASFDGPIESGLGSSAAAASALVSALYKIKGVDVDKEKIAEKAWDIEVNKMGLFGGKQDQYCSSVGGVNLMIFNNKGVEVSRLSPGFMRELLPHLTLFYLGSNRKSPKIQEGLKVIGDIQKDSLDQIKSMVLDMASHINNPEYVGKLMNTYWDYKKRSNLGVSNMKIDAVYNKAIELGAWGGKVLGAGGGGHLLLISPLDKKDKLIKRLGLKWVDFSIDWNGVESRIV